MKSGLFSFLLISAFVPLASAQEMSPDAFVKGLSEDVIAAIRRDKDIQAGDAEKISALVEAKILPHFDFRRTTQVAMGVNWRRASADQQERLTSEFKLLPSITQWKRPRRAGKSSMSALAGLAWRRITGPRSARRCATTASTASSLCSPTRTAKLQPSQGEPLRLPDLHNGSMLGIAPTPFCIQRGTPWKNMARTNPYSPISSAW